jgi:hypothetical protein
MIKKIYIKTCIFATFSLTIIVHVCYILFQGEPAMINPVSFETRQALEVRSGPPANRREDYPGSYELFFYTPPRIGNRSDALAS